MRKERVELSILRHKSAMRGSAVALTARTTGRISSGRTSLNDTLVKNADVQIVLFPVLDSLPYDPLNRSFSDSIETRTKSLEEFSQGFKKHAAQGGFISEWGDPISGIDIKKLRSIRGGARGYDPNATDADGDMLVQEGTPWQRISNRARRAVKKGKRRLADVADSTAERIEERTDRRASRRSERGSLRERLAGAAERTAARIDGGEAAPKPRKKRRSARQYMVGYTDEERREMEKAPETETPKPPKAEKPEKPAVAVDEEGKPEVPSPAKPLPEDDDDEWAKALKEWQKNSGATEDVTADTTAESKMPGKKYGTGTKDRDTALLGARDASKKNKDKTLHVVKGTDGKFRVVDDERLEAMGGKPVAAYKDGKIVMRDGAPVKKGKDSTTFKDIDSSEGWSGGGKFANEETAVQQASNIKNMVFPDKEFGPDDNIHVVKAEGGMYTLVDDEKLQALGVDPIASFNGDGKEVPWGATDPKPKQPKKEKKPKPVGEIPGEEPMPTLDEVSPKPEVTEDAKKKTPKLGGKQFGRPFKNEKSATKRADELSKDGNTYHVVNTEQGFRVVDQERLDAMGVEPLHTGGEFKPAPGMKPVGEKEPAEDKTKAGPSSFESMAGFKKEFDDIKKSFDDGTIEDSQVDDLADISNVLEELVAISDDPTEKNVASQFALEVSSLYAKATEDKKKTPEKAPTEPVATTTGSGDVKKELDVLNDAFFKATTKTSKSDSEELQKQFTDGIASLQEKISAYPDGPEKEELLALVKQASNKFKKWQEDKPTGKVLTKKQSAFISVKIMGLEDMLKKPKSEWTEDDENKFSEGFAALEKQIGFSGGQTSEFEFSGDLSSLRAKLFILAKNKRDHDGPGAETAPEPEKPLSPKEGGEVAPVTSQEIPNLNDYPVIVANPESSWDKLVEEGDVATLEKVRDAWKEMGKSIGEEGPAVDWAKKYVKLLGEKIKDANKSSKKKTKAPKKPLGKDETPVVYNPETGVMADISPFVDSALGNTNDPKLAKEKLDEIESEIKKIAKMLKPAGGKGGPDGPWAKYNSDQILTALSEATMNGDTPAQKRAAQLLLDLIDDEALDLTVSGNKKAEQVAEVFAAAGKKKISSMAKDKLDEETGIPTPEPGDTSVGALAGFTEKLKSFDVLMDEDTDFDEKIEQLWALKNDVDNYIADLKNENEGTPSDENEKQKLAAAQKMSNDIYGMVEDMSMLKDDIKMQSQEGEYAELLQSMDALRKMYEESEVSEWSEAQKAAWIKQLGNIEDKLNELDGESGIYGDEPWGIFSDLNQMGVEIANMPETVPGEDDLPKPGGDKPKAKFASKQDIDDHYTEEMGKVQQALINGNITKPQANELKTQLYKDKAKAELDLPPVKIGKDSPKPFKTSKELSSEDLVGVTQSTNNSISAELEDSRRDLVEFLLTENLINRDLADDPVEVDLEDGTKKEVWKPKEGISDDEVREAILSSLKEKIESGSDVGEIASLRTHLHNFDVLAKKGSYSSEVSPELDSFDRFNHLGPSSQKGVMKKLYEKFDEEELNKVFKKSGKKKAKKDVEADIKAVEDVVSEPEAPKALSPNKATVLQQANDIKAAGGDVWDDFVQNAPEGSILGVVADHDAEVAKMQNGEVPPFKNVNAELVSFETDKTGADGKKVGYWVSKEYLGQGAPGDEMDSAFPNLYKYPGEDDDSLKPGEKGGLNGGYVLRGDFTPEEGSPLYGKTAGSWSDPRQMFKEDEVIDGVFVMGFDYDNIPSKGSDNEKTALKGFHSKYGNAGGVLVRSEDGNLHYIRNADWKTMSDDDKKMLVVEMEVPKKWETWSGKTKSPQSSASPIVNDWQTLSPDDQKEMLQALLSQDDLIGSWGMPHDYQITQLGITDVVHVANPDDVDGTEMKSNLKLWVEAIADAPDHPNHTDAFGFYEVNVGPEGNKKPVVVKLGEGMEVLAKKHPDIFKQVAKYDGAGNFSDDFGDVGASGTKNLIMAMYTPDDVSWMDSDGVDGSSILSVAQAWTQKLDGKGVPYVEQKLDESDKKLTELVLVTEQVLLDAGFGGDPADATEEQLKNAFEKAGIDYDSHMTKVKNTSVRREATKKWLAANKQSQKDALEVMTEFNKKSSDGTFKKPTDLDGDISATKQAIANAEEAMKKAGDAIASGDSSDGVVSLVSDYVYAKAELKSQKETLQKMETLRENFLTEMYKGKTPMSIGGEEYVPKSGAVYFTDSPDVESATIVADAVSPLLKNGEQIGLFQLDNGSYAIIGMEEALEANLPAPEMVFTSQGKVGMMEADPTDMMDLLTSAGVQPVKEGYAGIENLGVSSDNGIAIGKYVPSGLPDDATDAMVAEEAAKWATHISNGGSLSEVPNELLLDVVWQHRDGNGSERFKFLTKASGYNDSVSDPKMRTHRFLDTATGHTFVIKSATRNDQEGIRELFGNQVMQSLGFPSSGGRTASIVFTAPNKYANYNHPEANANTPQTSVLLESSEMLYEGKNLGHVKAMTSSESENVISRLTPESVANGVVMDSLFRYYDRQGDNWLAIENPDGSVAYHPIDHGNAFGPFKGKKFADKNGVRKDDNSQSREDELGFMFVGLDGDGTWKLAQKSMTTPERRQRFAEAVLRAVHRAETTDYAGEAESLISGQNLSGDLAERARTSAKNLDEKKSRLKNYVDPMLKEMGMSDEEIVAARDVVNSEISGGLLKAGKAPKPVTAPGLKTNTMVKNEPISGEEAFGNTPTLPGAKTVTDTISEAMGKAQGISYASVGGGQVKGGVRFTGIDSMGSASRSMVMTLRIDSDTADGIVKSLKGGMDGSGGQVTVISEGSGTAILRTSDGKFPAVPTEASGETLGSSIEIAQNYGNLNNYVVAKTEEGHIIIASSGRDGYGFSIGDTVQVIMRPKDDGSQPSPSEIHDLMKRVGIKSPAYTADDEWKSQAAELLVRTYDKINGSTLNDPLATRLARVAGNHGLTVNDVEPYFDSVGRMRFRLKDEAWDKIKASKPDLTNSGTYIVKTMNTYQNEANVIRLIQSGGVLSKQEQVAGGYGAFSGSATGGSGHGASAESDLASGGGLGVFMSPFTSTGQHGGAHWGSRGTEIVFDGEEMLRDIGWWAHGPTDGPYGVLNPNDGHMSAVGSYDDPLTTMTTKKTFEFLPDASADLGKVKAVILQSGNSQARKNFLVKHYKDQGIDEINGIPVEQFFVATPTEAKLALPKFKGTTINGFKVSSAKAAAAEAAGIPVETVIPTGFKAFPSFLTKGLSSDLTYFPDGKLTKTNKLQTAMARIKKYSNANPGESYFIFQDTNGNYRVASEKFYNKRIKPFKEYTTDTLQYRFLAGQQMSVVDPDQEVM